MVVVALLVPSQRDGLCSDGRANGVVFTTPSMTFDARGVRGEDPPSVAAVDPNVVSRRAGGAPSGFRSSRGLPNAPRFAGVEQFGASVGSGGRARARAAASRLAQAPMAYCRRGGGRAGREGGVRRRGENSRLEQRLPGWQAGVLSAVCSSSSAQSASTAAAAMTSTAFAPSLALRARARPPRASRASSSPIRAFWSGFGGGEKDADAKGKPSSSTRKAPSGRAPGKAKPEDDVNMPTEEDLARKADIPIMLNNTPHPREVRRWFYDDCVTSVTRAVTGEEPMTRVKAKVEFPELNVNGDVYRVGTLLELVRELAMTLAKDGKRVRVCVQGSMGEGVFQGLPLSLSGVARILDMMDWGDADEFISRGAIDGDVPQPEDDFFILIAPQNIVGFAVLPRIIAMEEAAGDRPMIMINPKLDDIQSAGNVMSIRGRGERREYVSTWREVYHFRLLYRKPYFFPIYGAMRYTHDGKWELYKKFGKMESEEYVLKRAYDTGSEGMPGAGEVTKVILAKGERNG